MVDGDNPDSCTYTSRTGVEHCPNGADSRGAKSISISECAFLSNAARQSGAAIATAQGSMLSGWVWIRKSSFYFNSAPVVRGGARDHAQ